MADIKTGCDLGSAILKVLGIEAKMVSSVGLKCGADDMAVVTITRYISEQEGNDLLAVLEQYALERKPEDPQAQAMATVARNLLRGGCV